MSIGAGREMQELGSGKIQAWVSRMQLGILGLVLRVWMRLIGLEFLILQVVVEVMGAIEITGSCV